MSLAQNLLFNSTTIWNRISSNLLIPQINNKFKYNLNLNQNSINPININLNQTLNFSNSTNVLLKNKKHRNRNKSQKRKSKPINITFINPDGKKKIVTAKRGDNLLHLAHDNDIQLEGACEGSLACSTCHVIIDPKFFEKTEAPTEQEDDLLELAFGLTDTSRLACQIKITEELDGMNVTLPSATRNMAVDGYKPKPH